MLPSVTEAERRILAKGATKLYRPIDGDAAYRDAVQAYVFGEGHELADERAGSRSARRRAARAACASPPTSSARPAPRRRSG